MSISLIEKKDQLDSLLDNISQMFFEDHEFATRKGFTANTFADYESFNEMCELYRSDYGEQFKEQLLKEMRKSLYPVTEGVKKHDFDWDQFEGCMDECIENVQALNELHEQIEEVLYPDQELGDVELLDTLELMDFAIEYLKQNDLIQMVSTNEGEMYLLSNALKQASM